MLHGRDGNAHDMGQVARRLARPGDAVLAPQASSGSWYPLSTGSPIEQNEPMLSQSLNRVEAIVRVLEAQGVERRRIVLAGFSQGACLAAQFLFRFPARYAAGLIFSGGILGPEGEIVPGHGSLQSTPVLVSGSQADPYIRWARLQQTAALFRTMNAAPVLVGYPEPSHAILPAEYAAAADVLCDE